MGQLTVTAVTRTSGAVSALKDGTVKPAGFTLSYAEVPVLIDAFRSMVRSLAYDVIGGSGSGEQMACNKIPGVRAGVCHELFTAEIARANNDANVLIIGAKIVAPALAEMITELWLRTPFKGGRHADRLAQIAALERGESLTPD